MPEHVPNRLFGNARLLRRCYPAEGPKIGAVLLRGLWWHARGWTGALALGCLASLCGCRFLNGRASEQASACRQLSQRGKSALDAGDPAAAEALFAEAMKASPDDSTARRYYAEALWQRGARDEALAQAEEALRLDRDGAETAIQLGEMNLALGRLDEARRLANAALDADPQAPAAWTLRARASAKAGWQQEALADFHRALAHSPTNRELLLEIAELYRTSGQPQRALAALSLLLDCYASNEEPAQVLYLKGLALAALDRPADAIDAYTLALARHAPRAELLAALADARLQVGDAQGAASAARQTLVLDPTNAMAQRVLVRIDGPRLARQPGD